MNEIDELAGFWNFIVSNYDAFSMVLIVALTLIALILPTQYFIIGALLLTIVGLSQLRDTWVRLQNPRLRGEDPHIDVSNPVASVLTMVVNVALFATRCMYYLVAVLTVFMLLSRLNVVNSNVSKSDYKEGFIWWFPWALNKAVSVFPFHIFPLFKISPSTSPPVFNVDLIVTKFIDTLTDTGLLKFLAVTAVIIALLFGLLLATVKRDVDELVYRRKVVMTMNFCILALYLLFPIVIVTYIWNRLKEFVST